MTTLDLMSASGRPATLDYRLLTRYPVSWAGESALVGTVDELLVALDVLNRKHDRAILEQLAGVLGNLLKAGPQPPPVNLKLLMKALSSEDRLFVVQCLGVELRSLTGSAVELRNLLVSLPQIDVAGAVIEALGADGLRGMLATSRQLWEVLEWLYGTNDERLLELLGAAHLRRLVTHGHDLAEILRRIDPPRQIPTLELLGWVAVLALVKDDVDLREILSALCTEGCAGFLEKISGRQLVNLAGSEQGWYELDRILSPSKARLVRAKLEGARHAS